MSAETAERRVLFIERHRGAREERDVDLAAHGAVRAMIYKVYLNTANGRSNT